MKLKKFKEIITSAVAYAGETNPDIEVWLGEKQLNIKEISQFAILPTVVINLEEKK